jgi:hypothetical protein
MVAIQVHTVLLEEAAEVIVAQVAAILPSMAQRLIMIADHKQLRPKIRSDNLQMRRWGHGPTSLCTPVFSGVWCHKAITNKSCHN